MRTIRSSFFSLNSISPTDRLFFSRALDILRTLDGKVDCGCLGENVTSLLFILFSYLLSSFVLGNLLLLAGLGFFKFDDSLIF